MVYCSIWINSPHGEGMKNIIALGCTLTVFLPALLTLLITNITANHTVKYTVAV